MRISDWSSDVCSSDLLNSTTAMSRRALRDDMPGIILRTTVRAITRGVAQKQINETNPLAGLAVGLTSAVLEGADTRTWRSEEHTSELQSLMRISYAVFCLKKQNKTT